MSKRVSVRDALMMKADGNGFDFLVSRLTYLSSSGYLLSVSVYNMAVSGMTVKHTSFDLGKKNDRRCKSSDDDAVRKAKDLIGGLVMDVCVMTDTSMSTAFTIRDSMVAMANAKW